MILYHTSDREIGKPDMHCGRKKEGLEAVYLGVKDYGKEKTNRENRENFLNTLETKEGEAGYVIDAAGIAKRLSECGFGEWTQDIKAPDGKNGYAMRPGDVMSTNGHVWISLGTCDDGSVVIVHSAPSKSRRLQPGGGVQISAVGTDAGCEAYTLAERYMAKYYPAWYVRYPICLCDPEVHFAFEGEQAGRFSWRTDGGGGGFTDPDGIRDMKPAQVLELLFGISDCEHGDLKFLRNPHFSVMQGKGKGIRRMAEF